MFVDFGEKSERQPPFEYALQELYEFGMCQVGIGFADRGADDLLSGDSGPLLQAGVPVNDLHIPLQNKYS